MPYHRVGKEIFNSDTVESKGKSKSVAMAKRHLKALYANSPDKKRHRRQVPA